MRARLRTVLITALPVLRYSVLTSPRLRVLSCRLPRARTTTTELSVMASYFARAGAARLRRAYALVSTQHATSPHYRAGSCWRGAGAAVFFYLPRLRAYRTTTAMRRYRARLPRRLRTQPVAISHQLYLSTPPLTRYQRLASRAAAARCCDADALPLAPPALYERRIQLPWFGAARGIWR